jgi:putative ABC transport system permease protein
VRRSTSIAWLQLRYEKPRLLIALLGVGFAVVLILMQLGFQEALFASAARYHANFDYDLAMISPRTQYIVRPEVFARSRLVQIGGVPGVADVSPVYLSQAAWENPAAPSLTRQIYVVGFDPEDRVFALPGVQGNLARLRWPDVVLYDALSRAEFGPVPELFRRDGQVETEVQSRRVRVVGLFELGTSFGIDGSLVTSDLNFRRLFPQRAPGLIELGLVHLEAGADPARVRDAVVARIPRDVLVLTRQEFIQREVDYWSRNTPIGYVFGFGVIVGLTVGGIIVYQILFADVSEHVREYATLKAMGYTDAFLSCVVLQESLILAVLGFLPGLALALFLYRTVGAATQLPMAMTPERLAAVLGLTIAMCSLAAAMALRRVRTADPAEVF